MRAIMKPYIINTGDVFGNLTVIKEVERSFSKGATQKPYRTFLCKCKCGQELKIHGANLRSGNSKSCRICANRLITEIERIALIQHEIGQTYFGWTILAFHCLYEGDRRGFKDTCFLAQHFCNTAPIPIPIRRIRERGVKCHECDEVQLHSSW